MAETSELVVPPPRQGGTWLRCPEDCPYRTRRWAKYRRHWRRKHR
jgi:hypothetical protein